MVGHHTHANNNTAAVNTNNNHGGPVTTVKKGAKSGLCHLMSLVNLLLFIVIGALAAHLVDGFFDGKRAIVSLMTASPSVVALMFFALLASAVGIATSILGFIHAGQWNETARYGSLAANVITLALTWLAAGFGIRSFRRDIIKGGGGRYRMEAAAIASLLIIGMFTTLLYTIMLGMFKHVGRRDTVNHTNTGYAANGTHNGGVLPTHHKHVEGAGYNNNNAVAGHGHHGGAVPAAAY